LFFKVWLHFPKQNPVRKIAEKSSDNMALYFECRINKNTLFWRFCPLGTTIYEWQCI